LYSAFSRRSPSSDGLLDPIRELDLQFMVEATHLLVDLLENLVQNTHEVPLFARQQSGVGPHGQ